MKFKATKTGWQQVPKPKKPKEHPEMVWLADNNLLYTTKKTEIGYYILFKSSWSFDWDTFEIVFEGEERDVSQCVPSSLTCLGKL